VEADRRVRIGADEAGDVLEEDEPKVVAQFSDDARDVGPEPALVRVSVFVAGDGPGLTRETGREDLHAATPRSSVEGSEVVPDRRCVHGALRHTRNQCRGGKDFPLHVHDSAVVGQGKAEGELKAPDAGADGSSSHGVILSGTKSHAM
jgi:hypothetical protein